MIYLVGRRLPYTLKKRGWALREGQRYHLVVREVDDAGRETVIFQPEGTAPYVPLQVAAVEEEATPAEPEPAAIEPAPAAPARRRVPTPERRPRGGRLAIGKTDGWPTSKAAQIVYGFFQPDRQATTQDVVGAVGEQLKAAGIAFPGSLVSRLKQGGFLKEVA